MTDKMREDAIREAARNHAMDEYFNARKHLAVSAYETTLFEAGFDRAWQAARTVPEGFVVVPVEPTPKMLDEMRKKHWEIRGCQLCDEDYRDIFSVRLAAAPEGKK